MKPTAPLHPGKVLRAAAAGLLLIAAAAAVQAAERTLSCPDPGTVTRVGTCPSEAELRYTFTGYCSANERMYAKDEGACTSFEGYRRIKDVVLVESAGGVFEGYLSCRVDPKALLGQKPRSVAVTRKGNLTRVVCDYPGDVTLVHRTKSTCTVADAERCASDAQACKASCD